MPNTRPRRLLRNSKACDFCHKRRIKCQASSIDSTRCQNCADFDLVCEFTRPSRRARSINTSNAPDANPESRPSGRTGTTEDTSSVVNNDRNSDQPLSSAWQRFARASTPVVKKLLSLHQEIVHPIFPFFDSVYLEQRIGRLEHVHNRSFFCSVMAACAVTSARLRDGALRSSTSGAEKSFDIVPETYYCAAEEALPDDLLHCRDFDHLRGYALLALASIQDAQIAAMQKYIGQYFTVLAINNWHDEACWPQDLPIEEIEERRRVYWSMYTLDVYSAIVWDGCVHFQEAHAKVCYPGVANVQPRASQDGTHWIVGWNFTTDLYRILEHDLSRLRSRSSKFALGGRPSIPPGSLIVSSQDLANELFSSLPAVFKQLPPATGDVNQDIYGFQAANIQATMALARMVYLTLDEDVDLDKKCSVVSDVLSTFHQVPKPYLRAISTPLIYHIGGIGTILGSVMEGPMSYSSCLRVRDLLLSMAALLESLEAVLHQSAGAAQSLRQLVGRIQEYMDSREAGATEAGDDVHRPSNLSGEGTQVTWDNAILNDLSPQFQLPEELLQDWEWPFTMSNNYLSFQF
ncbi:hypothetical protein GE09DRAFT_1096654 [Coniochaeta sp. 2T2.1]|nr:hypothetical protein GE09DRAFT_1096654 [Coniochaeta sp. 2T2.1]